ncbi:hypothetical protein HID58_043416, partial [Brassica napus]
MERRFSRFEKGKGQAPPELPTKRPLVRIPANDYEDLIEVNRLTIIGRLTNLQVQKPIRAVTEFIIWVEMNGLAPLVMTMDIELPTADITEVEFEYIKIEKHCFTCFSLFHEEADCPHRPINALPPKERNLGITQSIGRGDTTIEEATEGRRTSIQIRDRMGTIMDIMRDTESMLDLAMIAERIIVDINPSYLELLDRTPVTSEARHRPFNIELWKGIGLAWDHLLTSSLIYQKSLLPLQMEKTPPAEARPETTPTRTIKERLGGPSNTKAGSKSDSKERRPALERLSGSNQSKEQTIRQAPSFENGRLQEVESRVDEGVPMDQEPPGEIPTEPERIPATHRLGFSASRAKTRRATIPIAAQSKPASKRRVNPIRKRVVRSPLLGLTQRKTSGVRSATSARRKLVVEQEKYL